MSLKKVASLIAKDLKIKISQVEAVIRLLDEGNTVPFIARYRKEMTGELNEEYIRTIEERCHYVRNLLKRKEDILRSISDQGKLTPELEAAIEEADILQTVEDLYLPFRPKKRTRALVAKERGLEQLALSIWDQEITEGTPLNLAKVYVNEEKEVPTPEKALQGAMDILAETIADRADIRQMLRGRLRKDCVLHSELIADKEEAKTVLQYENYEEPIFRMPSHRILAMNRGENNKWLRISMTAPHETYIGLIAEKIITKPSIFQDVLKDAAADSYKRLIYPSLEREIRSALTEKAEKQAITVFCTNLKQLLLQAPLAGHTIMGLDPGYRTGCKMAIIDPTGTVLYTGTYYLTMSDKQRQEAAKELSALITKLGVTLLSIGNGTASYETEQFVSQMIKDYSLPCQYLITNEAGASVYSASKLAKEELPDLDVSIRGAVSIARRIQDPLAESVKIDPKSIGVGQYQHDVNQKSLSNALDQVVESVVNHVGVDLNTASPALLQHVAGISASVAKNISAYRTEHGPFTNRKELLKVSRLGPAAFTQCAGFLRIAQGENPLDNTSVHPESYELAEKIIAHYGFTVQDLAHKERLEQLQNALQPNGAEKVAHALEAGVPTVRDIMDALRKPGRDPREDLPKPLTRKSIVTLDEIEIGSIVRGTVQNVVDFGAFIDFGLKTSGLLHISEMANRRIHHPSDIVEVGDIIEAMVISIDSKRNRIGLSLKQVPKPKQQA